MPSVRRNARTWTVLADFVGFSVEHRVEYLGRLLRDEPVESGPDMDVILKVRKIWTLSHSSNRSSEVDELELEKLDLDSS